MKNTKLKSAMVLLGTLLIGMVIGGLIASTLIRRNIRHLMDMRSPKGFQNELLAAAQPNAQQEAAIKPILADFSLRMDTLHNRHRSELESNFAALESDLAPHLDADQLRDVHRKLRRLQGRQRTPGAPNGRPKKKSGKNRDDWE